ncbi:3-dehydroquinate synthase [Candidatus Odyssella thessalonicensis]|uniref:3-dehydroquinate synthase n=1 Tax=Candidatus Odyssella thessalonicensis TaxID=84647 RepID=UPI000225AF30|nr:3-dehydroquinate synthase family protein [Candidatus Odyssella thessalonicensis]
MRASSPRHQKRSPAPSVESHIKFFCSQVFEGSIEFLAFKPELYPANSLIICDPIIQLPSHPLPTLPLESKEATKSLSGLQTILQFLADYQADRETTVIAVGGGSLLDVVGLAASIYMRGISWWAVPTTLLAMVDASVGGKTGLNFNNVKNLIGSFYPANKTIIDSSFLATLPSSRYCEGLAEIIKMAWILDAEKWQTFLNQDIDQLIAYAIKLKLGIVSRDWFEKLEDTGRILLNAGHTFGHAIERLYPEISHGQAVALGLIAEHELAEMLTQSSHSIAQLKETLERVGLKTNYQDYLKNSEQLIAYILKDKKTYKHILQMVVATAPGQGYCLKFTAEDIRVFVSNLRS